MKRKSIYYVIFVEIILCIIAAVFNMTLSDMYTSIVTFPFEQIALGLRWLSFSGSIGNLIAIVIFISIGVSPCIYLKIKIKKDNYRAEYLLLVLLSITLLIGLYLMINPAYTVHLLALIGMEEAGKLVICSTIYSLITSYVILRMLRMLSKEESKHLLSHLKTILAILCVLAIFSIFGSGLNQFISSIRTVRTGNTQITSSLYVTYTYLFIQFVLSNLSAIMVIWIIHYAVRLINSLIIDRYGEGTISLAESLARASRISVVVIILSSLLQNIIQILLGKLLLSTNYTVELPITAVLFVIVTMLAAKYLAESRALKKDNEMII